MVFGIRYACINANMIAITIGIGIVIAYSLSVCVCASFVQPSKCIIYEKAISNYMNNAHIIIIIIHSIVSLL